MQTQHHRSSSFSARRVRGPSFCGLKREYVDYVDRRHPTYEYTCRHSWGTNKYTAFKSVRDPIPQSYDDRNVAKSKQIDPKSQRKPPPLQHIISCTDCLSTTPVVRCVSPLLTHPITITIEYKFPSDTSILSWLAMDSLVELSRYESHGQIAIVGNFDDEANSNNEKDSRLLANSVLVWSETGDFRPNFYQIGSFRAEDHHLVSPLLD